MHDGSNQYDKLDIFTLMSIMITWIDLSSPYQIIDLQTTTEYYLYIRSFILYKKNTIYSTLAYSGVIVIQFTDQSSRK